MLFYRRRLNNWHHIAFVRDFIKIPWVYCYISLSKRSGGIIKMKNKMLIKQKTVVFQVMEEIKNMISTGKLQPNDKIPNEYELAEMFGVGRSSIREALKIFQFLGVVELRNPKGTFICESSHISSEALLWSMLLGKKDFKDLIELRMVLEHQGLWYLMLYHRDNKILVDETIHKLEAEVTNMADAIKEQDYQKRIDADYNFHKHIIQVCNNEVFDNLYATMKAFMKEEKAIAQSQISTLDSVVEDHQKLVDAIKEGDYYHTSEMFRTHIRDIDNLLK
jgi:DNA-binding FadR family transcriptional regulator